GRAVAGVDDRPQRNRTWQRYRHGGERGAVIDQSTEVRHWRRRGIASDVTVISLLRADLLDGVASQKELSRRAHTMGQASGTQSNDGQGEQIVGPSMTVMVVQTTMDGHIGG